MGGCGGDGGEKILKSSRFFILKEYVEQAGKINIEKAGKSGLNNRLYQPFYVISKEHV
ncbi:MAG: hypothetical protein HFG37_08820 [Eubacterium sp.]|nr:hypothetical protein [Eubacterium sp.]